MTQTVGQYLGKTKGPVIKQHAVSREYRERAPESTFEMYLREGKPDETFAEWKARVRRGR